MLDVILLPIFLLLLMWDFSHIGDRKMRCVACGKLKRLPRPKPPVPTGICRACSERGIVKPEPVVVS